MKCDIDVITKVKQENEMFMPIFTKTITRGVILCILSVIPLFLGVIIDSNELIIMLSVDLLLMIVAFAVYGFVKVGIVKGAYDMLLQTNDYTVEKKEINNAMEPIASIYWCIVVILYLILSFTTNRWQVTWIVWPVAGIGFTILTMIIKIIKN